MFTAQEQQELTAWHELWFADDKKAGFVAITDLQEQSFFGSNDIDRMKRLTAGKEKQYMSLNAFSVDFRNQLYCRRTDRLKQIRNIGIDLDHYNNGLTIPETQELLFDMVKEELIPMPNLILSSRGTQLFYTIAGGASPDMAWLSRYITEQFILKLQALGADLKAKDEARLMRVPESVNERNGATVMPEIWRKQPFTLQELQSYTKPLGTFSNRYKKRFKGITGIQKALTVFYRVNHARLSDLEKLIELRHGDMTNMRNIWLYMCSFHQSLILDSLKDTLTVMQGRFAEIYSTASRPMSEREFERTVKSAYKDAGRFFEHYKANGYRMTYGTADGIIKPYKTENVIEMLEITEQEQQELRTLVTPEIKRQHERERKNQANREKGMRTMQEYNAERSQSRLQRLETLADLMALHPDKTQREYAEMMNVDRSLISKMMKELKC